MEEEELHWTAEWIAFGFENMTAIGLAGVVVLGLLYGFRRWTHERPVLRRERWWSRLRRWWNNRD